MTGIFLQARMDSTRLPGKALLPLPGGTVAGHAMRALKLVKADVHSLLTDDESAASLRPHAEKEGFDLFIGPKEDVLARYCQAARHYGTDLVVRATGDNPLVSPGLALAIMDIHMKEQADLSHFLHIPLGTGVEVVGAEALFRAEQSASDPFEREHITTYLYRNPSRFRVCEIPGPPSLRLSGIKVSVDTPGDYSLIRELYDDLYNGQPIETENIVAWFREKEK